jgi:hypothetical protein
MTLPKAPAGSTELVKMSFLQGGRGNGLKQQSLVSQHSVPIRVGQSPGPGTACTVFLGCNGDTAYLNAQVDFIVMQFGHEAIFKSLTIDESVLSNNDAVQLTATGCAADYWEIQITLLNGTLPAAPLQSSILATGVEILGDSNDGTLVSSATIGTGGTGDAVFSVPLGISTWLVTGDARVTTAGGGAEAVGDAFSETFVATWKNVAGVVTVLPPTGAAVPWSSADTSQATGSFGPADVNGGGTEAFVPFVSPAGADPGSEWLVVVTMKPIGAA